MAWHSCSEEWPCDTHQGRSHPSLWPSPNSNGNPRWNLTLPQAPYPGPLPPGLLCALPHLGESLQMTIHRSHGNCCLREGLTYDRDKVCGAIT